MVTAILPAFLQHQRPTNIITDIIMPLAEPSHSQKGKILHEALQAFRFAARVDEWTPRTPLISPKLGGPRSIPIARCRGQSVGGTL